MEQNSSLQKLGWAGHIYCEEGTDVRGAFAQKKKKAGGWVVNLSGKSKKQGKSRVYRLAKKKKKNPGF